MGLVLGPIPPSVRAVVVQLIAQGCCHPPNADERLNGLMLTGGPTGCSYLDADGEVWNWSFWDNDESVERVPDGMMKIGLIAIAAERFPELAVWLPARPAKASDCKVCKMTGSLQPLSPIQCPECSGLGWLIA
jgi:hypothetical protein